MARHHRKKNRRIHIEFRPSQQATAHGGQMAVNALAGEFGLWERIEREPALDPRRHKGKGYDPTVVFSALVFNFTNGGVSLADAERLDGDDALKTLLGIKKFPDQSTLGEWLRGVSDEAGNDVSSQRPAMLKRNAFPWKDFCSCLYADSASSAGKYLEAIDERFDHWSVSHNKWTSPLERGAAELAEVAWSQPRVIRWHDGSNHPAQHAWLHHQSSGCRKPKLCAVTRHKMFPFLTGLNDTNRRWERSILPSPNGFGTVFLFHFQNRQQ